MHQRLAHGLQAAFADILARGNAGLIAEAGKKLAAAEAEQARQFLHRQASLQMGVDVVIEQFQVELALNACRQALVELTLQGTDQGIAAGFLQQCVLGVVFDLAAQGA
eukprot:Anaeramoba_flamelloidesa819715_27.p3 GENE.a819715_27~~a819715_27.p3  ORF type:complete len:108 (-),score=5.51 a819715_27:312-635(-)